MRPFLIGLIVGGLLLIASLLLNDSSMIMYLLMILGIIPIVVSGFISGAFASGDRIRANYSDANDFSERSKISTALFLFGIPCLLSGVAIYFLLKK